MRFNGQSTVEQRQKNENLCCRTFFGSFSHNNENIVPHVSNELPKRCVGAMIQMGWPQKCAGIDENHADYRKLIENR